MQNAFFKYFPLLGFILVWTVVISLHQLSLFNIKPVSNYTFLVLLSALLAFVLGYYLFAIYDKSLNYSLLKKNRHAVDVNIGTLTKIVIVLSLFLFAGGYLTIYVVGSNLGGMDIYLRRPLMVRQFIVGIQNGYQEVSQLYRLGGYLSNIGMLSTIFGGILFACKGKIRLVGLLPFTTLLFSQLAVMGRYKFVIGLVFFFVSFILYSYFQDEKLRKKRLIEIFSYGITSVIILISLSYLILKLRSPLADDIIELVKESGYLYLSAGITALDKFIMSDFNFLYGESSFRSIFRWLSRLGIWPEENVLPTNNEFVKVSTTFRTNTYTFVRSLYQDFGIYGLIIVSFTWGALTKHFIFRVYKKFTVVNILIAAIFVFSLLISFFSFYFQGITGIAYWIIVAIIIQYFWGDKLFVKKVLPNR